MSNLSKKIQSLRPYVSLKGESAQPLTVAGVAKIGAFTLFVLYPLLWGACAVVALYR